METAVRKEIMPSVFLTCVGTDKFKTSGMSVSLLTRLDAAGASKNAVLPHVLRRGTARHSDMESLSSALDELYGARIEPVVRKKGEIQCVGFYADFIDDAYAPDHETILEQVAGLLGEVLLTPATRGGLLLSAYVDGERENLADRIRAKINDKRQYSTVRLIELMCAGESFSVDKNGSLSEAAKINAANLTKHYRELLAEARVEIFYCGSAEQKRVENACRDAFGALPRKETGRELWTDIKTKARDGGPEHFTEELDVTQGKLVIGFRIGEAMLSPDYAALLVFNAVYGGSVTSKLFENVREKLSLCYYASSMLERYKGIMLVSSGIEIDKYDEALAEIFAQLDAVRNGEISADELQAAINDTASSLLSVADSPDSLEEYYLGRAIDETRLAPDNLAALCRQVTVEDVAAVGKSVQADAVYFLKNSRERGGTDE